MKAIVKRLIIFFLLLNVISCGDKHNATFKQKDHYTVSNGMVVISKDVQLPKKPAGYTIFLPADETILKGTIIFFQDVPLDTTQQPDEMNIVQPAIDKGLAVAFIATGKPFDFLFDEADLLQLDSAVETLIKENQLPANKLLFAGLSLSGTRAIRYSIWCQQNRSAFAIHPAALVLCDAPIDMLRMYDEHYKAVQRNFNSLAAGTAAMILPLLQTHLGLPTADRDKYIAYSPYSYADSAGGNAKYLVHLPVRAYHEPDINWWIKNRGKDYYSMNSIDMAGLINQLSLMGNTKAELITLNHQTTNPAESPHTWNIVDNKELVDWFLKCCPD